METLTAQGASVPKLGLGTWNMRGETCRKAVLHALGLGYRLIDTAEMYQNESEIGKAISRSNAKREEIFVTTKVWSTHLRYRDVLTACEASLRRLRLDYVDLLLVHWPNPSVPIEETMGAMQELKARGKTRHIGVSNFSVPQVQEALQATGNGLLSDQVEFHPFQAQDQLLGYCQKSDLILTAYTPLARGRVVESRLLNEIGEAHGRSAVQVTLRWLLQQDRVIAIPKAASPGHQEENLSIFDFELSPDEMERISQLAR